MHCISEIFMKAIWTLIHDPKVSLGGLIDEDCSVLCLLNESQLICPTLQTAMCWTWQPQVAMALSEINEKKRNMTVKQI